MSVLAGVIESGTALVLLLFGVRWLLQGIGRLIAVLSVPRLAWPALRIVGFAAPMVMLLGAAALAGEREMAVGGIVGLQMLLLLPGLGARASQQSVAVASAGAWRDSLALVAATLLFLAAAIDGNLARWEGGAFLLVVAVYLAILCWSDAGPVRGWARVDLRWGAMLSVLAQSVAALGMLAIGSVLLIDGASVLGRATGLQSAAVGALLLAGGVGLVAMRPMVFAADAETPAQTGLLPYLAAALLANVAIVALLSPTPVPPRVLMFDVWMLVVTTGVVLLVLLGSKPLSRIEVAGLNLVYFAYLTTLFEPLFSGIR